MSHYTNYFAGTDFFQLVVKSPYFAIRFDQGDCVVKMRKTSSLRRDAYAMGINKLLWSSATRQPTSAFRRLWGVARNRYGQNFVQAPFAKSDRG